MSALHEAVEQEERTVKQGFVSEAIALKFTENFALCVERDVLNRVCVSLECSLVLARLEVPHLDRRVLRGRDQ